MTNEIELQDIEPGAYLLAHPHIPKPLHGLTPRSILGKTWWNIVRRAAYARHNHTCWACGLHKNSPERIIKSKTYLEGHEYYRFDYHQGRAYLIGIVALCPACHMFIHMGRTLAMFSKGEVKIDTAFTVIEHGCRTCYKGDILPWWGTIETIQTFVKYWGLEEYMEGHNPKLLVWLNESVFPELPRLWAEESIPEIAEWGDWRLVIGDKEYPPKFATQAEWMDAYNPTRVTKTLEEVQGEIWKYDDNIGAGNKRAKF